MLTAPQLSSSKSTAITAIFCVAATLSAQSPSASTPYLDPALPTAQRVDDLVSRMTLEEKISQMQNDAPAIPRLHVAAYNWWNEGLHGVARSGYATVFPQAIGLAATWDTALIHQVADTISTEARAKYNQAQREGNNSIYYGLTFWSPNINIVRDPRWGRGQETYGEDPFLTGSIGASFVEGLQGSDPHYFKVIATAKHFAVHSGPESSRHAFDAVITPHDLADTYLPAFRSLVVDAHADSVMCAYNSIDGAPACASKMLLQNTLHDDWHFNGYVVSDCAAITDVAAGHKYAPDLAHAAAVSVLAGTDLSCGHEYSALLEAVHHGLIDEAAIDAAVKRLFTARFRLGMFDPSESVPYNQIPFSKNDSPAHAALALKTAQASIVLLKNDPAILPLKPSIRTVAVVGPNAASLAALEGNYNAVPSHPVTPLSALQARLPGRVNYAQGSAYVDGAPVPVPECVFTTTQNGHLKSGLVGEYFNGSDLSGHPVVSRIDPQIDFDWNAAAPSPGILAKNFSVRWTGSLIPPAPGTLRFGFTMSHCSTCNDAESISVWLDGKLAHDFQHATSPGRRSSTPTFDLTFTDTHPHAIRIEYTHSAPHFGAGLTFNWQPPADVLRTQAVAAASASDAIVAFLGLSPDLEGEEMPVHVEGFTGGDRTRIELPAVQQQLVSALEATGKPLIIVLLNGSALALQHAAQSASAVLEAWYPGQAGGTAIADTLLGDNNPSGRLPLTFYASTSQLPQFEDYSMNERTYRYFTGQPLYSFGYGLSYTTFEYSNGKLSTTDLNAGDSLEVSVGVRNTGERDGDETVEVYLIPKNMVGAPLRVLVGFEKVFIPSGAAKTVRMEIGPRQLSFVSSVGNRSVRPGDYDLYIGGGQPSAVSGVFLPFRIQGSSPVAP
jgi:beta-glucosidase